MRTKTPRTAALRDPSRNGRQDRLADLVAHQAREIRDLSTTVTRLQLRLRHREAPRTLEALSDRLSQMEKALGLERESLPTIKL